MERLGTLGSEDLEYKKNLEVALLKLSEIQKNLAYRVVEYGQLVRVDPKDIELEGRRFYELEDFDKKYSLEIFRKRPFATAANSPWPRSWSKVTISKMSAPMPFANIRTLHGLILTGST